MTTPPGAPTTSPSVPASAPRATVRLRTVDAFTDRPFSGNPAAVVVLDAGHPRAGDEAWMRGVAAELNLSETAFAVRGGTLGRYGLRWFTPTVEVDLCGHATLAAAHVLHADGETGPYVFTTRSGDLRAEVGDGGVVLDLPAKPVAPVDPAGPDADLADRLAAALAVRVEVCARGGDDVLVEVADEETVRALVPDLAALAAIDARGVVVTAAAAPRPVAEDAALAAPDVVSRFFGPRVGVAEDPVTGSAHCALAPYWAPRLGRTRFTAHQVSPRGGVLEVELRGDRVLLTGRAVTVLDAQLLA